MLTITKSNYDEFKQVFVIIWHFQAEVSNIDPNVSYSPISLLNEIERESESIARRSLKVGLNDSLSMISNLPFELKDKLDNDLKKSTLFTLNKLTAMIKDIPVRVLKRMKIKSIDEYYILKEVEQDVNYDLSSDDKRKIQDLLMQFESEGYNQGIMGTRNNEI